MNRSPRLRLCVVAFPVLAGIFAVGSAVAQDLSHCLDNSGARSVPAGTTYEDADGTWTCAPAASDTTSGGWLKRPRPLPVIPTDVSGPAHEPVPPPRSPSHSQTLTLLAIAVGPVCIFLVIAVALVPRRLPRLHGHVLVFDKQRSTRVDLARYRRLATVGTNGTLRLTGEGVLAQHAELRAEPDGQGGIDVVVRPKEGSVSLLRGKHIVHVAIGTPLHDRDEIVIGAARLQYRDLAAGVAKLTG